jgi:hypothetical protein
MTAEQYLLSEAEFCRRIASQSVDRYLAGELSRLAGHFEASAAQRHAHGAASAEIAVRRPRAQLHDRLVISEASERHR